MSNTSLCRTGGCSFSFISLNEKKDFVISSHRPHAHYISKGGDIKKMIAEIYGKESGSSKGRGGSMHLVDLKVNFMGSTAIVGNSVPVELAWHYLLK